MMIVHCDRLPLFLYINYASSYISQQLESTHVICTMYALYEGNIINLTNSMNN